MSIPKCYSYTRFSSSEQSKGDSIRRQTELAQKYAEKHNLILDTELTLEDKGLSAFSGAHIKKGALGVFLDLVESGKIPEGSTLIVESLDRLSREQVLDAFAQFQNIIKMNIKIVTLSDEMEYSQENINKDFTKLIISLAIMSRSYEESLQKSKRLKSAWSNKRRGIGSVKLTSISPAWMKLSSDKTSFELNSERVLVVKDIFSSSVSGYGIARIAKSLNKRGVDSWGGKRGWHSSYIHKILRNRAVIGEFQPYTKESGKRVPEGDPIIDYFPKVIDEALFYQVQNRLTANASYSGKTGPVNNLFGGLAKCGYCSAPMQFVNKGIKKGWLYLVCDSARRGRGCDYLSISYDELEFAVLTLCKEIDFDLIFSGDENETKNLTSEYMRMIEACEEKITLAEKRLTKLTNTLSDEDDSEISKIIKDKMLELIQEIAVHKTEKVIATKALAEVVHEKEMIRGRIADIKTLYNEGSLKDIDVRIKLRNNLRSILSKITVYPVGQRTSKEVYRKVLDNEIQIRNESGISYDVREIIRLVKQSLFYGINDKRLRTIELDFKNSKTMTLRPLLGEKKGYFTNYEIDGKKITMTFPFDTKPRTISEKKSGAS